MLSFHWHPEAHGETDFPHQHIGGAEIEPKGVLSQSRHLPSGRIAFEEVLLWCITDLKVVPRRLDWERVLRDNRDIFVTFRTWSTTPGISTC